MTSITENPSKTPRFSGVLRRVGYWLRARPRETEGLDEQQEPNAVTHLNETDLEKSETIMVDAVGEGTPQTRQVEELASDDPQPSGATLEADQVTVLPADLRKKELIEQVVARSGMKKKDVKPVVEAVLAELGAAVSAERGLNLEPFGKLRINRAEERANGRITVCRLRQNAPSATATQSEPSEQAGEALAEATE